MRSMRRLCSAFLLHVWQLWCATLPCPCMDAAQSCTRNVCAYYRAIVRATDELKRNAKLISGTTNNLGFAAAIFEPAPLKSRGTSVGITVQLLTTFLYMANYNLVIPTVDNFMEHLKVWLSHQERPMSAVSSYLAPCSLYHSIPEIRGAAPKSE